MKNYKKIATLTVSSILMSGCASIISQSTWPVAIKSVPEAASFSITNQKGEKIHSGTTPSTVNLASGAGYFDGEKYTVQFSKPGYQEKVMTLDTGLNGWYWGNFVFGGALGLLIIDPATGAMFRLPESFSADLTAQTVGAVSSNGVVSLNDIPQDLRANLIPVE